HLAPDQGQHHRPVDNGVFRQRRLEPRTTGIMKRFLVVLVLLILCAVGRADTFPTPTGNYVTNGGFVIYVDGVPTWVTNNTSLVINTSGTVQWNLNPSNAVLQSEINLKLNITGTNSLASLTALNGTNATLV